MAAMAVGVFANVAYTLGSIIEVTVNNVWGKKVLPVGPMLFRQGVLFSVGLTFVLPTIIITIGATWSPRPWVGFSRGKAPSSPCGPSSSVSTTPLRPTRMRLGA